MTHLISQRDILLYCLKLCFVVSIVTPALFWLMFSCWWCDFFFSLIFSLSVFLCLNCLLWGAFFLPPQLIWKMHVLFLFLLSGFLTISARLFHLKSKLIHTFLFLLNNKRNFKHVTALHYLPTYVCFPTRPGSSCIYIRTSEKRFLYSIGSSKQYQENHLD